MKKFILSIAGLFLVQLLFAQVQPLSTSAEQRLAAFEQRKLLKTQSIVNAIPFRSVGPSVFSGRVVDMAVSPNDPSHFYVAYASGGLWKTVNNGMSFEPIFEKEAVLTIGDIYVDWERDVIWVGTGENNSSRSSYAGLGMYKSEDGGKTWQHKGLSDSHHIGRIIADPADPNTLWVAALGHLYSPNRERGIFKTTDGGETWRKVLYVNENTGGIDLVFDPNNKSTLYAGMWHRERRAWNFVESGEGSGIYKSTDAGETWVKVTITESGFPSGDGVGRIGLAVHPNDGQTAIFAVLDNYFRREKEETEEGEGLTKTQLSTISKDNFLALEDKQVDKFLKDNRFPKKYSTSKIKEMVRGDKIAPIALVEYLEDANSLLFDTPVTGAEVYKSLDGGATWQKTHQTYLDGIYYSYGYYFGQIRVAPDDVDKIYIMGVPVLRSDDGGATFKSINGDNVHADHHALYVNPNRKGHLILGNDGGINISYDDGEHWIKCNTPPLGQFYSVAVDMQEPYNVYGGLQDNGVWMGSSTYKASTRWHGTGQYPYKAIMGGDGMQVAIDTRDNETVYTGFQFGNYFRLNTQTGARKYITPKHELGERPLRWNWQSPLQISTHNQDIIYFGSNKLHRSLNQGDSFKEISPDLTTGGRKGDVAFSTITSIHESPLKFGLIYVGTDDGLVHVTRDGGYKWTQITNGLPQNMWVTRVWASAHEEGTVYAALNGYRWDDFSAYLYRSDDYGASWESIGANLPAEPINTVKDDSKNADILYVGTDNGLYISLDKGQSYMLMDNGLPVVAVHDLVVHPTKDDLVIGTHGRSIYIADIAPLRALTEELLAAPLHVFTPSAVKHNSNWGVKRSPWRNTQEPTVQIPIYAKEAGTASIAFQTEGGVSFKSITMDVSKGINYIEYDLTVEENAVKIVEKNLKETENKELKKAKDSQKIYLPKGTYKVEIACGGSKETVDLVIE